MGQLLDKLDELGIADNTIVMYSTDNGAEELSWPDGGVTPFRGEKDTKWEGGWRVPTAIRWPGVIKPGTVFNEILSHQDMLPTILAAAGDPDIVEKCKKGYGSETRPSRCISTDSILGLILKAKRKRTRAQASFIGAMKATSWHFATATGRFILQYNAPRE